MIHPIAAKYLIAPLAYLDNWSTRVTRKFREVIQRHAYGVRQRFILDVRHPIEKVDEILVANLNLVMIGAEGPRDRLRILEFVCVVLANADGVGLDRPVHQLCHECNIQRGVNAAAQEHPKGNVRYHATGDSLAQQPSDLFDAVPLLHLCFWDDSRWIPIPPIFLSARGVNPHVATRLELSDRVEQCERCRSVSKRQVVAECSNVELRFDCGVPQDRLDL